MNYRFLVALMFVATLFCAGTAGAVDGTIDINQAKVLAAGGFPYSISSSGSYRLTGNLTVSGPKNAIQVAASNVSIDLNGFSIVGGSNSFGGVVAVNQSNVIVKNGVVTSFNTAVSVGTGGVVENVIANSIRDVGIHTQDNAIVRHCTANSALAGIQCFSGCSFTDNTIIAGSSDGIDCESNCLIGGNTISYNSSIAFGISCGNPGCLIQNNIVKGNGTGIEAFDSTTSYGNNVLTGNVTGVTGGTSLGAGNTNLCDGSHC